MEFRLLGPMECLVEGTPVRLGRPQERCLLAVLLLHPGEVVPLARLVELLWDDAPPARTRSIVHTLVSRLRLVLREVNAERHGVHLRTRGRGYALDVPLGSVDVHRFRAMIERSRSVTDPGERATVLRDALAMWRGAALADTATEPVREQICAGLDEQRVSAMEDRAEAELAAGRHHELVTELTDLAARYPLRERLVGLLMVALYRSGRQADALTAFAGTRRRLVDELGVEPGVELRTLHRSILSQDATLDRPRASPVPPGETRPPGETVWRGVRSHLTAIVGRDAESMTLARLLDDHRMVTVIGMGGVGKTTLVLHIAEVVAPRLGRDVAVVSVAPLRTLDELVLALGAVLGAGGTSVTETLTNAEHNVAGRPHLLVLDNCEHLAEECAELLRRLLAAAPSLTVLATSRVPLRLPEETVWPLEPLSVPTAESAPDGEVPAMALFLRRARDAWPGFTPTPADLAAAARICRRVDGLPLALELAACRLRTLPAPALADELEGGLGLLTAGPLTATLDWSCRLLTDTERLLLARLSVFRGGFDADAAARVCTGPPIRHEQVLPTLAALLDHSLVHANDVNGVRRYRLLEVVRDHTATQLAAAEDPTTVLDQHLDHWLDRVRSIAARDQVIEQVQGWLGLREDQDDLRAATDHAYDRGRTSDAVEMTALLFGFWVVRDVGLAEIERSFDRARPHVSGCGPSVRGIALSNMSMLSSVHGDYVGSLELARAALTDLRGHRPGSYLETLNSVAHCQTRLLDPDALPMATELLEQVVAIPDRHHYDLAVVTLADAMITWGRYEEAARLCARHDPASGRAVAPADVVRHLITTCLAALGQGDLDRAADAESRLHTAQDQPGNYLHPTTRSWAMAVRALVALPPERARTVIGAVIRELGERLRPTASGLYAYRILLAEAHRLAGDPTAALTELTAGLADGRRISDYLKTMPGVLAAALLAADLGDLQASDELASRWDRVRRRLGLPVPIGFAKQALRCLGLDPAAPRPNPDRQWHEAELADLVARAHDWCAASSSALFTVG